MEKNELETIAKELLVKHNLSDWKFEWDKRKTRFGVCVYAKRTISISWSLAKINTVERFTNTMLHEIAHALVGSGCGHNFTWRQTAERIGAQPKRCIDRNDVTPIPYNYVYVCNKCNSEIGTYKRLRKVSACKKCCDAYNNGRYTTDYLFVLKQGEQT